MKASRMLLSEIKDKYPSLPFTMRSFTDSRAKLGMTELMKHDLVCPYPVRHPELKLNIPPYIVVLYELVS